MLNKILNAIHTMGKNLGDDEFIDYAKSDLSIIDLDNISNNTSYSITLPHKHYTATIRVIDGELFEVYCTYSQPSIAYSWNK